MKDEKFIKKLYKAHIGAQQTLSPVSVYHMLNHLLKLLFPALADKQYKSLREFQLDYQAFRLELFNLLKELEDIMKRDATEVEELFTDQLPVLRDLLNQDADAILEGDPAAVDKVEVIRTYPGFMAIAIYRIAHELYTLKVPLIPRILTEYAHGKTGVDIHPGATVGKRFCIDHGTGLVIGETVEIGDDVKIYQGVTLGALSVSKEMAKTKRHPTIQDRVVIYAGATILGGRTIIGHDSIIGGNVWITKSIPANSRVSYRERHSNTSVSDNESNSNLRQKKSK